MPSYEEVTQRAGSLQALTGLTQPEFLALLPQFEHAFLAYMEHHTIDGHPRTSRRYRTYDNTPLPAMADKLLFILTYLQQNPIQAVQGQLFGLSQSNANKWLHLLHTVLNRALAHQDLLPARTADELAVLLARHQAEGGSTPPLFGRMGRNARFSGRKIRRSRKTMTVARRSVTRAKPSW